METRAGWTKLVIGVVLGLIGLGVLIALVINTYQQEVANRTAWLSVGADQASVATRLDVTATVQSIDPVKGEMVTRLDFFPQGELAGDNGWSATKDLTILTNSSLKPEIDFKKGQRLNAVDVTMELYNGLYTDYPFDSHDAELQVYAVTTTPAASSGEPPQEESVPINVELFGIIHGFGVQADAAKESADDFADINLHITRSNSTLVWALFVMGLLWFMALGVAGVTIFVVTSRRKLEFGAFAWLGAMLFAFVSFRSAAPGVPPIGALIDFVAFFWAEFIVAICLVTLVIVYLARRPN